MQTIDQIPPGKAFVFGAALSGLNPKNLALDPRGVGIDRAGGAQHR